MKPQPVDDATLAFPANVLHLMPPENEIPKQFSMGSYNKWAKLAEKWFYRGLPPGTEFLPKDGIDEMTALRHISAIMWSYEPKHQHKMAAIAFLLSEWFLAVAAGKEMLAP